MLDGAYHFLRRLLLLDNNEVDADGLTQMRRMWQWGALGLGSSDLDERTGSPAPITFFGGISNGFWGTERVRTIFEMIASLRDRYRGSDRRGHGVIKWQCYERELCGSGAAYADPFAITTYYLCPGFWDGGVDNQTRLVLHEPMHYLYSWTLPRDMRNQVCTDGTSWKCYREQDAIALAAASDGAFQNIDNYVAWMMNRWDAWGVLWPPQYNFWTTDENFGSSISELDGWGVGEPQR